MLLNAFVVEPRSLNSNLLQLSRSGLGRLHCSQLYGEYFICEFAKCDFE
jgi:hypothetical protein